MQFNVSLLLREPIGSRRHYQVYEPFSPDESENLSVPLDGSVDLLHTDRGILASAKLVSTAAGECDRCLRPAYYPVTLSIEEEFLPTVDPVTGGVLPPPEDAEMPTIDAHHILDLTDIARQIWLLESPMQVLCHDDCLGLCTVCGADRNARNCACDTTASDSRWAALAQLSNIDGDHMKGN